MSMTALNGGNLSLYLKNQKHIKNLIHSEKVVNGNGMA